MFFVFGAVPETASASHLLAWSSGYIPRRPRAAHSASRVSSFPIQVRPLRLGLMAWSTWSAVVGGQPGNFSFVATSSSAAAGTRVDEACFVRAARAAHAGAPRLGLVIGLQDHGSRVRRRRRRSWGRRLARGLWARQPRCAAAANPPRLQIHPQTPRGRTLLPPLPPPGPPTPPPGFGRPPSSPPPMTVTASHLAPCTSGPTRASLARGRPASRLQAARLAAVCSRSRSRSPSFLPSPPSPDTRRLGPAPFPPLLLLPTRSLARAGAQPARPCPQGSRRRALPSSSRRARTRWRRRVASTPPWATCLLTTGAGTCTTQSRGPTGWETKTRSTTCARRRRGR